MRTKFDYWNDYMVWWRYLLPIPIGICYALLSPKLAYIAAILTSKDISAKRMLEKAEASKILELEAELQEARNFAARAAIDRAELKERASNIKDQTLRDELRLDLESIENVESKQDVSPQREKNQLLKAVMSHNVM